MNKILSREELRILDTCRDIELLNEQLYRHFAQLFSEDRELADLWRKTANEEANHAQQFELAIRAQKEMLESVTIDPSKVDSAFKFVRTILEIAEKSPPSVADALQLGVKLEERLSALHLECIAGFADESYKALFRSMMANDDRHIQSLLDAREKYSKCAR